MADFIILTILVVIIGAAVSYIVKARKKGVKCIGCPEGCNCSNKNKEDSGCGCGCGCNDEGNCGCHSDIK